MNAVRGVFFSFLIFASALAYLVFGKDFIPSFFKKADFSVSAQSLRLKKDVQALVSTAQPRSVQNLKSLNQAASYIQKEWEKLGLHVYRQTYQAGGQELTNLRVVLGPTRGERWVIGAHYDVCTEDHPLNPGADDNASGVAVLLELSRLIVENKISLRRPLELVAFSSEEPPHFATPQMGSYIHAESLKKAKVAVKGMLSLEMLGYFTDSPGSQEFPFGFLRYIYPDRGNFLMVAGDLKSFALSRKVRKAFRRTVDLPTHSLNAPDVIRGIQFSDHRNYAAFGFRAVMLTDTAFYRNKNYHRSTDTWETLNFEKMAEAARALAYFTQHE